MSTVLSLVHGVIVLALVAGLTIYGLSYAYRSRIPAPLPPGPKGLPLLGNVLDFPTTQSWKTFEAWGNTYGGITHAQALGNHFIVLNDAEHATNLLNKRSKIYSDRPVLTMAGVLVGWDKGPALIAPNQQWSEYRRLFAQFIGSRAKIRSFDGVLLSERNELLKSILSKPQDWVRHGHTFAGAIVLMLAYGYRPASDEDKLVRIVVEAMNQFSESTVSNAFMVDVFPIMRFIPPWLPGAAWKAKAVKYRTNLSKVRDMPYAWTKEQVAKDTALPSFVSEQLTRRNLTQSEEHTVKWAAVGIYSGGAETSVAVFKAFVLAMTLQVTAQRRAQVEIDSVIGRHRLPNLDDRERLPYCEAMFQEVLRVYTIGPIGLPHVASEDDVYEGYYIPKGSIIITNNWHFYRDPKNYKNPENFTPERFMPRDDDTKERDPRDFLFGYGRRVCPGTQLADASLWLACISLLSVFDITSPHEGKNATESPPEFLDGSISHPAPFECLITPRSADAAALTLAL